MKDIMKYLKRVDKNFYKWIPKSIECKNFCLIKVNVIYFYVEIAVRYVDIYIVKVSSFRDVG